MGDWVRYKLDRQVDHVLVDEAQDTNAAQWAIIEPLVEEFFSGSSEADERRRTLFMVGDFKQAIYGFQGTDPQKFGEAREEFRARAEALREAEDLLDTQRAGARVPRPVDRRQLPLGAADPRRRRRGDRDGRPSGDRARASRRRRMRAPCRPARAGRAVAAVRGRGCRRRAEEGEERWISLRDRRYAD